QPLGPLRSEVVQPHVGGWDAHGAYRWKPDPSVFGGNHQIAVQHQIGTTGQTIPVDLSDDGNGTVPHLGPPRCQVQHGRDVTFDGRVRDEVARLEVFSDEAIAG